MIETVRTREELERLVARGEGYLYNDFGGRDPKMCPVHAIGCMWVERMTRVKPGALGVKKLWSPSLEELVSGVIQLGKVFVFCGSEPDLAAQVRGGAAPGVVRASASTSSPLKPAATIAPRHVSDGGFQLSVNDPKRGPIECWSDHRLNFEPKDYRLVLRRELGTALADLRPGPGEVISGTYESAVRELADVENVLFYNVGLGRFREAASHGVRFERSFAEPSRLASSDSPRRPHLSRYEFVPAGTVFAHWSAGATLASWADVPAPPLGENTRVGDIWLRMKRAAVERAGTLSGPSAPFGMRLCIRAGAGGASHVALMMKPLLDAVCSALHQHDGTDLALLAARLAGEVQASPADIADLLMDDRQAILGARAALHRWRDSVQWNPADDGLVAAEVLFDERPGGGGAWSHSGELFAVEPVGTA